jgi:hypothetical protein
MPETSVLYSVTAAVVVGLCAWVAVVLNSAKEPWARPPVLAADPPLAADPAPVGDAAPVGDEQAHAPGAAEADPAVGDASSSASKPEA